MKREKGRKKGRKDQWRGKGGGRGRGRALAVTESRSESKIARFLCKSFTMTNRETRNRR